MEDLGHDAWDRRPVVLAAAVALGSLALVLAAARYGWLGPDVGRGDRFCEAPRPGWVRQPASTWSNVGFVVAGILVAVRAGDRLALGVTLRKHPALATAFAVLVVLLGPGSMAMHATGSVLGGHLDLLSMVLLSGFAASYAAMRALRRGPGSLVVAFLVAVVGGMAVHLHGGRVPALGHVGNAVFAAELWVAVGLEVLLVVRGRRRGAPRQDVGFGLASVGTLAAAFAIWTTGRTGHPWCDPSALLLQQHAVWHVLDAVAAYLLFRHYAAEGGATRRRAVSAGSRG